MLLEKEETKTAAAKDRLFPEITEAGLDDLRRRIGVKIGDTAEPWCYEATRDNIRHYAHGIGDDNPLWCDPDYAATTKHGGIIALPSFLFSTSRIISGYVGGLPGVHAMWSGADWTWHKTVHRNDEISTEAWLKELVEHQTRFAGRAIQQTYHVELFQSARRPGGRSRQLVFSHRARSRARAGHQVQGRQSPRRRVATPTKSSLPRTSFIAMKKFAARLRATGTTSLRARRCRRCSRAR